MKLTEERWEQAGSIIFVPDHAVVCELSEPNPEGRLLRHEKVGYRCSSWNVAMVRGQLIKTAPKLLAALKGLVNSKAIDHHSVGSEPLWEAARVAIAEAEEEA